MATYSNAQILSAILNKFFQPVIQGFAGSKLASLPFVQAIENKARSTGWVGANWSLSKELSPIIEGVSGRLAAPFINRYLAQVDDASLPLMAHTIIDNGIESGGMSLFDGNVELEIEDLRELKRLLNINLPLTKEEEYTVLTEAPKAKEQQQEQPLHQSQAPETEATAEKEPKNKLKTEVV